MRIRSFRVPFSRVVGDDAHEVEYGPDDYLVVRPIFGLPTSTVQGWINRIEAHRRAAREASDSGDPKAVAAIVTASEAITLDLLGELIVDWHLESPDGTLVPKPAKPTDLAALPFTLRHGLFDFLQNYRGDAPDPTTRS